MDRRSFRLASIGFLALLTGAALAVGVSRDLLVIPWLVALGWACVAYVWWRSIASPLSARAQQLRWLRWLVPLAWLSSIFDINDALRSDLAIATLIGWVVENVVIAVLCLMVFVRLNGEPSN